MITPNDLAGAALDPVDLVDGSAYSVLFVRREALAMAAFNLDATVRTTLATDLSKHLGGDVPPDDAQIVVVDKPEDVPMLNDDPMRRDQLVGMLAQVRVYVGWAPPAAARKARP